MRPLLLAGLAVIAVVVLRRRMQTQEEVEERKVKGI